MWLSEELEYSMERKRTSPGVDSFHRHRVAKYRHKNHDEDEIDAHLFMILRAVYGGWGLIHHSTSTALLQALHPRSCQHDQRSGQVGSGGVNANATSAAITCHHHCLSAIGASAGRPQPWGRCCRRRCKDEGCGSHHYLLWEKEKEICSERLKRERERERKII